MVLVIVFLIYTKLSEKQVGENPYKTLRKFYPLCNLTKKISNLGLKCKLYFGSTKFTCTILTK